MSDESPNDAGLTGLEDLLSGFTDVTPLKRGGQKSVYRAKRAELGDCVVKVGQCAGAGALERIRREVELLRMLQSPYFPRNHSFSVTADRRFVIVEEYVPSNPLVLLLDEYDSPLLAIGLLSFA